MSLKDKVIELETKLLTRDFQPLVFYIMLFIFILSFNLLANAYDYDLWARLIVGKCFWQTGHVLKHDFLSYTPTHTWYDHEWGSGVIFYFFQHLFGAVGLLMLQVVILFLIYVILSKIIKLRGVTSTHPYNFLFYFFSLCAITQVFDQPIRCQLFTFFFFTLFLYILELARHGKNKYLISLPFLMLIWNNIHGGCVAGLGLIFMYIVGELINRAPFKKYILPFLFSILVLPINPWGIDYIYFLIMATTMKRPAILEWFSLFDPLYAKTFFEFKTFSSVMCLSELAYIIKAVRSRVFKFDATKYIVVGVTLYLGVSHIKHIPLAVITMSAFFYDDFYTIFNLITADVCKKFAKYKDYAIFFLILMFAFVNIKADNFKPFVEWNKFPIRVVEFIRLNNLKGNLLVNFGQGSFVSYKLYPHCKIYMDGRYEEVYDNEILSYLQEFLMARPHWDFILKKFPTDMFIVEKTYPIYIKLATQKQWTRVFYDNNFALFVKTENLRKSYIQPPVDMDYYEKHIFDTYINFMLKSENEKKK